MSFKINRGQIIPNPIDNKKGNKVDNKVNFEEMLYKALNNANEVKISSHAQQRMNERNINLDKTDMNNIKNAIDALDKKGAKESLMLYKDHAFITSVTNRTIITSMDVSQLDIVTNIDSAIIIK